MPQREQGGRWGLMALCAALAGCASARPTLMPAAPMQVDQRPDGGCERRYDASGDGVADYVEELSPAGRVEALRVDADGDGACDHRVVRAEVAERRQLILILDSVPFELARQQYARGRLRLFHPPAAVIAPFPAVTDVCLDALFGTPPALGVESEFFDGRRVGGGWSVYHSGGNSPWLEHIDVYTPFKAHGEAYWHPQAMLQRELAAIERYLATHDGPVVAYLVSTSGLGYAFAHDGHVAGLVMVDRFCAALMERHAGALDITLLSDHGHTLLPSRRPALVTSLRRMGYRVGRRLARPGDIVIPNFGMVNYVGLYTRAPAQVAADVAAIAGVELAMYRDGADVVVNGRNGRARIRRRDGGYVYAAEFGDPLKLAPLLAEDPHTPSGVRVEADALIAGHRYPDALDRVYRAFDGQVQHPPDVLISLADGWHWGSPFFERLMPPAAVHGNLNRAGTVGFAMTTAGELPDALRTRDLRRVLATLGVPLAGRPSAAPAAD